MRRGYDPTSRATCSIQPGDSPLSDLDVVGVLAQDLLGRRGGDGEEGVSDEISQSTRDVPEKTAKQAQQNINMRAGTQSAIEARLQSASFTILRKKSLSTCACF